MNRLISKIASMYTTSLRFESEYNADFRDIYSMSTAFPRLHFMISSLSPIINRYDYKNDTHTITQECFNSNNFFVKIQDLLSF